MQSLRAELSRLRTLLAEKQAQTKKDKIAIANLGKELNNALANKVQELQQFRSEFFGRLRVILERRSDVKIVGDRFVFQSEVLFAPGQATINPEGQAELGQIADAIMQILADIPSDIPWILQIEGHTDDVPVSGIYTDNWDLSTERALSVVRFMIDRGISSERLAATGYGEFQPITTGKTDASRQKNRRIELKLTQIVRAQ
jgi:chemotaxis protein MotB